MKTSSYAASMETTARPGRPPRCADLALRFLPSLFFACLVQFSPEYEGAGRHSPRLQGGPGATGGRRGMEAARPGKDVQQKWWNCTRSRTQLLEQQVRISNQTIGRRSELPVARAWSWRARSSLFPRSRPRFNERRRSSPDYASSREIRPPPRSSPSTAGIDGKRIRLSVGTPPPRSIWGRVRNTVAASAYPPRRARTTLAAVVLSSRPNWRKTMFTRALDDTTRILTNRRPHIARRGT